MKHAVHIRPSFKECAQNGYYFCRDCQRVVERREHDYMPATCAECGSTKLNYYPPVIATDANIFANN